MDVLLFYLLTIWKEGSNMSQNCNGVINATDTNEDVVTCCKCKADAPWGGDEEHTPWMCENPNCGECFCNGCFIEEHGTEAYYRMVSSEGSDDLLEPIHCPSCYQKNKEEK